MTDSPTPTRPFLEPRFHRSLKRAVPTTGIGTVRFGCLVKPDTLAAIEKGCYQAVLKKGQAVDQLWEHAKATGFQFRPIK